MENQRTVKAAIKLLETASGLIAKGWTKGVAHRKVGNQHQYCLVGALRQAHTNLHHRSAHPLWLVQSHLRKMLPLEASFTGFNDRDSTKLGDVQKVLGRTIKSLQKNL